MSAGRNSLSFSIHRSSLDFTFAPADRALQGIAHQFPRGFVAGEQAGTASWPGARTFRRRSRRCSPATGFLHEQRVFGIVNRVEHHHRSCASGVLIVRRFVDVGVHADRAAVDHNVGRNAVAVAPIDRLAVQRMGQLLSALHGAAGDDHVGGFLLQSVAIARAAPPAPSINAVFLSSDFDDDDSTARSKLSIAAW